MIGNFMTDEEIYLMYQNNLISTQSFLNLLFITILLYTIGNSMDEEDLYLIHNKDPIINKLVHMFYNDELGINEIYDWSFYE
jgi:hypothetical protein